MVGASVRRTVGTGMSTGLAWSFCTHGDPETAGGRRTLRQRLPPGHARADGRGCGALGARGGELRVTFVTSVRHIRLNFSPSFLGMLAAYSSFLCVLYSGIK